MATVTDPLALAITQGTAAVPGKPTPVEVMREVFKDMGEGDDCEWVLFNNGTFYTFPKSELGANFSGDDLVARALDMSQGVHLLSYDDNDCVTVMPFNDVWTHPTYVVLSCLRQKVGWVIVGESPVWAENEQQEAAVGYLARTRYEMDAQENKVVATSFPWSGQ